MDYWNKEYIIDKKYKLKGYSKGGIMTSFILFPHNIFLDAGVPSNIKPKMILITHGHQDHIDCLYNYLIDTDEKTIVITNKTLLSFLQDYLNSCKSVNAMKKCIFSNWQPMPIITELYINICNTQYRIKAYNLDHEIETFGYGIEEIRYKLKEEYLNLNQFDIEKLKKENIDITEQKNYPILFFCGDMNFTSLNILPFDNYPLFIIECTFLYDEHIIEARQKKHLHILDLIPFVISYTNTMFIFIHFSNRYHKNVIKDYQKKYETLKNLLFWI